MRLATILFAAAALLAVASFGAAQQPSGAQLQAVARGASNHVAQPTPAPAGGPGARQRQPPSRLPPPSTAHRVSRWKKVAVAAIAVGIAVAVIIGFTHKSRSGCFPYNCAPQ